MEEKPKKKLIRETIKYKLRAGEVLKKVALALGLALVFGLAASFAFAFSQPLWTDLFKEEEPTTEIRIFEEETTKATEPSTEATSEPESEPASNPDSDPTSEPTEKQELTPEDIKDIIKDNVTIDEFSELYKSVAQQASKSMVKISTTAQHDLLDQRVPVSSENCGVVIAKVGGSVLILSSNAGMEVDKEVYVAVSSDYVAGSVKSVDKYLGIAIIAVPLTDMSEADKKVEAIAFGNSSAVFQGSPVIAVGKPTGVYGSVSYGVVSYVEGVVSVVDGSLRAFQTDMFASKNTSGILVNTNGELVAFISDSVGKGINSSFITAIALNDLKKTIEDMSNVRQRAELGVYGQSIGRSINESQGIPIGVYVTETVSGRAAENAGILPGDVIIGIKDTTIANLSQLTEAVKDSSVGEVSTVKIMRNNRGTWTELSLEVTFGSR